MATHSSALAWRIPGTGETGGLPSMGLHRVGHDWSNLAATAAAHPQWEGFSLHTVYLKKILNHVLTTEKISKAPKRSSSPGPSQASLRSVVLVRPPAEPAEAACAFWAALWPSHGAHAQSALRMRRGFARQVWGGEVRSGEGVRPRGERAATRARTRGRGPGGEGPARGQGGAGVPERTPGQTRPFAGKSMGREARSSGPEGKGCGRPRRRSRLPAAHALSPVLPRPEGLPEGGVRPSSSSRFGHLPPRTQDPADPPFSGPLRSPLQERAPRSLRTLPVLLSDPCPPRGPTGLPLQRHLLASSRTPALENPPSPLRTPPFPSRPSRFEDPPSFPPQRPPPSPQDTLLPLEDLHPLSPLSRTPLSLSPTRSTRVPLWRLPFLSKPPVPFLQPPPHSDPFP